MTLNKNTSARRAGISDEALKLAEQLIREFPDTFSNGRWPTLRRFAAEMVSKGFSGEDVIDATEYANEQLCHPGLPIEQVHIAIAAGIGNVALSDEKIRQLLPVPEPEPEKIVYVQVSGPALAEPDAATVLQSPGDVDTAEILQTDYLVKGWLDRRTLAQVFGQWGSGKTFVLLHLGAHVAAGVPWFGCRVKQGGVLYIGYEGARSMSKRIEALKREFPAWDWSAIPFRWQAFRWPMVRKGGLAGAAGREKLEQAIAQFQIETGEQPALIIIDPLRDALGGSDSDTELTGPYMTLVRQISHTTGATVLTVHHPGHGNKDRGRGDSGIPGGLDTDIRVSGDKGRGEISAVKQRDQIKGRMFYQLKAVELGQDSDGDPVTTCVAEQTGAPIEHALKGEQLKAWNALAQGSPVGSMSEGEARERCKAEGIAGNHATRALTALAGKKLITWDKDAATITLADLFPFPDDDEKPDQSGAV